MQTPITPKANRVEVNLQHLLNCDYEYLRTKPTGSSSSPNRQPTPPQTAQRQITQEAREVVALLQKMDSSVTASEIARSGTGTSSSIKFLAAACRCTPPKAIVHLEKAAAEGSTIAEVELAECLLTGKGTIQDVPRAFELFDKACGLAYPNAMLLVGRCLRDGTGLAANPRSGFTWIKRAADLNYAPALHELGEMYESGVARSSSSKQKDDDESNEDQEDDFVLEKDTVLAFRCYKTAAQQKFPESQLNLAKLYLLGSQLGLDTAVGEAESKALYFLTEAANNGQMEAKALLERHHSSRRDTKTSSEEAVADPNGAKTSENRSEFVKQPHRPVYQRKPPASA